VAAIVEAARADGFATGYEFVPVDHLFTAEALWLVSSGCGLVLVTTLDGRTLRADPDLASRVTRHAGF
jgi:4-amino-4-deoxychorismate lyase